MKKEESTLEIDTLVDLVIDTFLASRKRLGKLKLCYHMDAKIRIWVYERGIIYS